MLTKDNPGVIGLYDPRFELKIDELEKFIRRVDNHTALKAQHRSIILLIVHKALVTMRTRLYVDHTEFQKKAKVGSRTKYFKYFKDLHDYGLITYEVHRRMGNRGFNLCYLEFTTPPRLKQQIAFASDWLD